MWVAPSLIPDGIEKGRKLAETILISFWFLAVSSVTIYLTFCLHIFPAAVICSLKL